MKTRVWVLADDRAGNVNQLLGVAEALGWPYEIKEIRYNKWVKLPNFLQGASMVALDAKCKKALQTPWPDVVLSAGRRSFPIARAVKRLSKGKTKIVQLMHPGRSVARFADLLVLPDHDKKTSARNTLVVTGAPHRITSERLKNERKKWEATLGNFPKPRVALLVGGSTKGKAFPPEMARELVKAVAGLKPGSVITTTSRRTHADVVELLQKELPKNRFFYRYGDKQENPYFGLLAWADCIVVTGDSISMCSECCGTGKTVYVFAPDGMVSEKHARFLNNLYAKGYAMDVLAVNGAAHKKASTELNPAADIAHKVQMIVNS